MFAVKNSLHVCKYIYKYIIKKYTFQIVLIN